MNVRRHFNSFGSIVSLLGSAIATAGAVECGRAPQARHLKKLGIDPKQFNRIGTY